MKAHQLRGQPCSLGQSRSQQRTGQSEHPPGGHCLRPVTSVRQSSTRPPKQRGRDLCTAVEGLPAQAGGKARLRRPALCVRLGGLLGKRTQIKPTHADTGSWSIKGTFSLEGYTEIQ